MTTQPDRRSSDIWPRRLVEAFGEVRTGVQDLDTTVKKHTEERRKARSWVAVLIVIVTLFTTIEVANLAASSQLREDLKEITCDDARDTRNILRPILEESLPGTELPPPPEECR